jgi:hypothetical protein
MFDPSKDYVRQHERSLQREAQHQIDSSDRPWEHGKNPLLRRQRNHPRQLLILVGFAIVVSIVLFVLFS